MPDRFHRSNEMIHKQIIMLWRGCKAEPFRTARNGRIIDWLHVNAMVIEEIVAGLFAQDWVPDEHRNNVRGLWHHRNANLS